MEDRQDGFGIGHTTLKRPWPFEPNDNINIDPFATQPFKFQWDINLAWDPSYLNPNNNYLDLDLGYQQENVFDFSQPLDAHVMDNNFSLPSIFNPEPVEPQLPLEDAAEICFGSIIDVKSQLKSSNPPLQGLTNYSSTQGFQVVPEGNFYSLEAFGNKFATINRKTCDGLRNVLNGRRLRLQIYIQSKEWSSTLQAWQKDKNSAILTGEINIYGAREIADEVGEIFSTLGIYLQQPRYGLSGFSYYNPHYFQIPGFYDANSLDTPVLTIEERTLTSSQIAEPDEQSDPSAEVDSILDSLSHHDFLSEKIADRRIRSPLLPHQKEAIDFIFRRETSQLPAALSLWKYNDSDSDEPFYQHVLSGAKRSQQSEAKGGILADDMGLGKTLVILATIAGSLERGEDFIRAENQNTLENPQPIVPSKATLIVAPSSLLINGWIDEIRKHTFPGDLSFHKHHGQGREAEADKLRTSDIVLTTYATVAAEFCRGGSILAKVKWFRIVLDEGHDIRNKSTKQFQAVANLVAVHRWCLTGTPIQNSLEDLGALVAFLKVPILENAPTFRKFITNQSATNSKDRFSNLRLLLGTICLRRTRVLLNFPEPVSQIRKLCFTSSEQAEYNDMMIDCRTEIDMAVSGHRKSRLNSTVLESLLKLRLFCNNGSSNHSPQLGHTGLPLDADEALSYLQQNDQATCIYCTGSVYTINNSKDTDGGIWMATCAHLVCRGCLPQHQDNKGKCPCTSNENITPSSSQDSEPNTPNSSSSIHIGNLNSTQSQSIQANNGFLPQPENQYPSKLLAFLDDIQKQKVHKSIAFSSWKKTLALISQLLTIRHIPFYCIDGSLSLSERGKVLTNFRSPNGANILLMTLGTGAVGLNLAVASRIYLLEPQWNPSIELQAIGRALRLGQTDQVTIVRYIMKNTVEDSNVLSKQTHKLKIAGGGFTNRNSGISSERLKSLMGVFGVDVAN